VRYERETYVLVFAKVYVLILFLRQYDALERKREREREGERDIIRERERCVQILVDVYVLILCLRE
jgi:hypothetical protein